MRAKRLNQLKRSELEGETHGRDPEVSMDPL